MAILMHDIRLRKSLSEIEDDSQNEKSSEHLYFRWLFGFAIKKLIGIDICFSSTQWIPAAICSIDLENKKENVVI